MTINIIYLIDYTVNHIFCLNFLQFDLVIVMFSALVSQQPGEKVVNYPVRPVDTTTDFEGTASLQPSQPVRLCCFKFLDHYANLKSHKYSTSMLPLMGLSFSY